MLKFLLQFFEVQLLMVLDIGIIIPLLDFHFFACAMLKQTGAQIQTFVC